MKFLVDNQLPRALATWIAAKGIETRHVLELNLDEASDHFLWKYAAERGFVLVTKDEDFSLFHLLRQESVSIVWVRLGNCRNSALIERFEAIWETLIERIEKGDLLIEIV